MGYVRASEKEVTARGDALSTPLLACRKLTKDYGPIRALDHLDLEMRPGEILGLLGPNGSGKSTTIRLILGFLQPTDGTAAVAGFDCWRQSVAVRQRVSYLPGELRLYENMNGWQLLRFLGDLRGGLRTETIDRLRKAFDIDLTRPLSQMSSGMKRKVALLAVLTADVPLLILDEPTNTLDPTMRSELLTQLVAARDRGKAVLFSSHVLTEVERVCDRVAILKSGRLAHLQAMSELKRVRRIRFRAASTLAEIPAFEGLQHVEHSREATTIYIDGSIEPVLKWLAGQTIDELSVESVGLESVYARYHGPTVEE